MNKEDWAAIEASYVMLKDSKLTKIEGDNFTMYKVGLIIRIDIRETK